MDYDPAKASWCVDFQDPGRRYAAIIRYGLARVFLGALHGVNDGFSQVVEIGLCAVQLSPAFFIFYSHPDNHRDSQRAVREGVSS